MDIALLGDGKEPSVLQTASKVLRETGTRLVLSHWRFVEAVGLGKEPARERFTRILDAGVAPLCFKQDPRDVELEYFHRIIRTGGEAGQHVPMSFDLVDPDFPRWLAGRR